ncbi:hypothetical protein [Escherichia coli]|uniref:hypothetical protein n=1 Tax=Escherichia coli TaxID=562 RepID=UPI003CC9D7D2
MFLMRLAVDTYNTQFREEKIPQKAVSAAVDKGGAIAVFYDAFESFFDEKLAAVSDFGTSSNK